MLLSVLDGHLGGLPRRSMAYIRTGSFRFSLLS